MKARGDEVPVATVWDFMGGAFRPFSPGLWATIVALTAVYAFFFWLFEHGNNDDIPDYMPRSLESNNVNSMAAGSLVGRISVQSDATTDGDNSANGRRSLKVRAKHPTSTMLVCCVPHALCPCQMQQQRTVVVVEEQLPTDGTRRRVPKQRAMTRLNSGIDNRLGIRRIRANHSGSFAVDEFPVLLGGCGAHFTPCLASCRQAGSIHCIGASPDGAEARMWHQ